MQESLYIRNFGGITEATIPLRSINVFIGEQGTGKSLIIKLVYFFREALVKVCITTSPFFEEEKFNERLQKELKDNFERKFPEETWNADFEIQFTTGTNKVLTIRFADEKISILEDTIKEVFALELWQRKSKLNTEAMLGRKNYVASFSNPIFSESVGLFFQIYELFDRNKNIYQTFIPAGRSFFAILQNAIFTLMGNDDLEIDPFVIEFGKWYEQNKRHFANSETIERVLGVQYIREKREEYLLHKDGRKVKMVYASSGQQETFPLLLALETLKGELPSILYVEEPEAHIFPSTQKEIVRLLSGFYNQNEMGQLFITTHSPYILSSFNNLLQAGQLIAQGEDAEKVHNIIPKEAVLAPDSLAAYLVKDGQVIDILHPEYGIIDADFLDSVSNDIAREFDALLDL